MKSASGVSCYFSVNESLEKIPAFDLAKIDVNWLARFQPEERMVQVLLK